MVSLRLHLHARMEAPKVIHYVVVKMRTKEVKELELDLRTNDDNQVKLVEETSTFLLKPKKDKSLNYETNSLMTTVDEYNGLSKSTLTYLHCPRQTCLVSIQSFIVIS